MGKDPVTPEKLDQEVLDLYKRRRLAEETRLREREANRVRRLKDARENLLCLKYWPPCGKELCVRATLAMDDTVVCDQCGTGRK
jgi:hypothetical protein